MKTALLTALLALSLASANGYHILGIFGIPSRSHDHLAGGFVKALLKAGHEVTWVTPYPKLKEPTKNLHIIDASITEINFSAFNMSDRKHDDAGFELLLELGHNVSSSIIELPQVREALLKNKYDAVVTDTFFSDVEAGYAAVLQVPWILLSGVILHPDLEAQVDELRSPPVIPLFFNDAPVPMNLLERAKNVALYTTMSIQTWLYYHKTIESYETSFKPIAAARGVPLPPLHEARKDVSILFVNGHNSFAPAQSIPPNVVEIGGYHIEESIKPLPKDLQNLLDSSSKGVVYFSMGSVFKSANIPVSTRNALIKVLGELPYTVLWKFETDELKDLPKNVHVRPWMPQAAILAHKNTRTFISHGGLLSTLESLRYGVPVIAIPVISDQHANAARAVRSGYALRVAYNHDTMAQNLREALKEMLGTDKYYKQAKYLSSLFNNRPVPPSKLIPYYVELAIETQGAHHLRSKAQLYTWYQRWMLDLAAILLAVLIISYYVIKKTLCFIYCKVTGSSCKKETKKDSKKVKRN